MRTAEEIKEWLEKSYFYDRYVNNIRKSEKEEKEIIGFIQGGKDISTINGAFTWENTKEGFHYWEVVENLFREWYNSTVDVSSGEIKQGRKNDIKDDKLRWDLLPLQDIEEIVKVFHAGAKKYGDNNWQNLENGYERYKAALFRHLLEVEKGNEKDDDTGCYHIAQVATNAIFMLHIKLNEYKQKNGQD